MYLTAAAPLQTQAETTAQLHEKKFLPGFAEDVWETASLDSKTELAKQLAAYCREHEIEVIHAQYPRENIIALLSLRHYAAPKVVYTNHLTIRSGLKWRVLNRIFTPRDHKSAARGGTSWCKTASARSA